MKSIELSFEFFPPKTSDGVDKLRATRAQLGRLKPKFVSVTFGAGGSTQQGTLDTVLDIAKEGVEAAPHLSCIGSSKESLRAILEQYRSNGIRHIVWDFGFGFDRRQIRLSGWTVVVFAVAATVIYASIAII